MRTGNPSFVPRASFWTACSAAVMVALPGLAAEPPNTLAIEPQTQEAQQPLPPPPEWSFAFTPYAWLMGINGSVTAKGMTTDVNANIIDLLQHTDTLYGFMGRFEARKQAYSLYLDVVYSYLGGSKSASIERTPFPRIDLSANANAAVSSSLLIAELGGGYALWSTKEGGNSSAIDAISGVRYYRATTDLSADVTVDVSRSARFISFDASRSRATASTGTLSWADPFVGLRIRDTFGEHHRVDLQGDVGGFSIGSYLAWQVRATYSYTFSAGRTSWEALVGYRALGIDYSSSSGDAINAVFHGPVIGVTARF